MGYFRAENASEVLENAKFVYEEHYVRVRCFVQLLNYKLGSDWKPLCNFLGKEEPKVDFPWVNEAASVRKKMGIVIVSRLGEAGRKVIWPFLSLLAAARDIVLFKIDPTDSC